jgi:D-lactate dehydrogenase
MEKKVVVFFESPKSEERFIRKNLGSEFTLRFFPQKLQEVELRSYKDADALSVFIYSRVDAGIISKLKRLRLVATRTTGFNHIDLSAAKSGNVTVCNVPYYGENTVAEHTFGLILSLSRNIHRAYARTARGDFSTEGLQGFDLKGKTLGVVGAGNIGLHVIKMARAFGMRILVHDVRPQHFLTEVLDFEYCSLLDVLHQADILTLHCPYNEATHHLLNMNNIRLVRPGCLFINTARGGLIETEALHYALNNGIFAGAGLDVFEGEELLGEENQMLSRNVSSDQLRAVLQKNILLKMDHVILTPHMAYDSVEAVERILKTTCENITGYFKESPQNAIR